VTKATVCGGDSGCRARHELGKPLATMKCAAQTELPGAGIPSSRKARMKTFALLANPRFAVQGEPATAGAAPARRKSSAAIVEAEWHWNGLEVR